MADATRYVIAKLDLDGNEIKNFAVDNVDALPEAGAVGRFVYVTEDSHLYCWNGEEWTRLVDDSILVAYQLRSEKDQPDGYLGLDSDGMVDVRFLPTGNDDGRLPLLKGEILDGQSIRFSQEADGFVAFEISTLYEFKGTCTSAELDAKEDPRTGDTWNLSDTRIWRGKRYDAGTSWAWEGAEWEPLAGTVDLAPYQLKENLVTDIDAGSTDGTYPSAKAVYQYVQDEKVPVITDWSKAKDGNVPASTLVKGSIDEKTDIGMAIPMWEEAREYSQSATVVKDLVIYISLQDSNIGNDPAEEESEWWTPIRGGGGDGEGVGTRFHTAKFGNDRDTVYTIVHGYGTKDILYSIRTNGDDSTFVNAMVTVLDNNTVTVEVTNPPGPMGLSMTIVAKSKEQTDGGQFITYTQTEPSKEWHIYHGMGCYMLTQVYDSEGDQANADIRQEDDLNSVVITFGVDMTGYVVMASTDSVNPVSTLSGVGRKREVSVSSPVIRVMEASGSWVIRHDKQRLVLVQCYDDEGDQMFVDVQQDVETLDTVTISFHGATSGTVIIL